MRIDLNRMRDGFLAAQTGKRSRHAIGDRVRPALWQYDYLTLSRLARDVRTLIAELPAAAQALALDLGSDKSPYRELLTSRGYDIRTLDITRDGGADYAGTAEATGLPDASFDLVLCTQVIERCMNPWAAARDSFGALQPEQMLRIVMPAVFALTLGVEIVFSSFFLNILGLRRR